MAKDNRIRLPSGQGGLTRFSEETKSKIQISPTTVIVLCLVIMILVILLHSFGGALLS